MTECPAWDVISPHLDRAPTVLLGVSFLGYPELVEIEAIAVVREPAA